MPDLDDFPQYVPDAAVMSAIGEIRVHVFELAKCNKLSDIDATTARLHEAVEILKLTLDQARKARRVYGP